MKNKSTIEDVGEIIQDSISYLLHGVCAIASIALYKDAHANSLDEAERKNLKKAFSESEHNIKAAMLNLLPILENKKVDCDSVVGQFWPIFALYVGSNQKEFPHLASILQKTKREINGK